MVTSVAASRSRKKPVPEVVLKQGVKTESHTCFSNGQLKSDEQQYERQDEDVGGGPQARLA